MNEHLVFRFNIWNVCFQCTDKLERDRLIGFLHKLILHQRNVKEIMDANGIKVLVDLLTLAHLHTSRAVVPLQVGFKFAFFMHMSFLFWLICYRFCFIHPFYIYVNKCSLIIFPWIYSPFSMCLYYFGQARNETECNHVCHQSLLSIF